MCRNFGLAQDNPDRIDLLAPNCRAWGCPDCGPARKRQFEALVFAGQPNRMLTLTMRRTEDGCPLEAAERLLKAWASLLKRIKRKRGHHSVEFCWVIEGTKAGWPHLHVALRTPYLWQGWIKKTWKELTGDSDKVWINPIDGAGAARYLSKYLAKKPVQFGNHKRYHYSRGWAPGFKERDVRPKVFGEGRWHKIELPPIEYVYKQVQQGCYPEILGEGMWRLWKRGYWPERFKPPSHLSQYDTRST